MLCTNCGLNTVSTREGLCGVCAVTAPGAPAAPPGVTGSRGGTFLQSPVGLGRAVVVLLCAVAAVDLFAVFTDLRLYGFVSDLAAGTWEGMEEEAERADLLLEWGGRLQVLGIVATGVVFIIWLHRVRKNAAVFAPDVVTSGAGWAIGGWFVPIANLFMPRRIARESWRASTRHPHGAPEKGERATVLNTWWTLWLLTMFTGRAAGALYDRAETVDELVRAARMYVVADTVSTAAALCAALFVHRLTTMQHAKALRGPGPVVAEPMVSSHTQ
ncbi:DUF4328 domain-containing protein [Streptomyces ficellus]|uniref:DUF4328 domain-containing protein n=1 Tax=Streptomyces ficellus TaxID=1977088 RepID=A0A6I6FMT0_9ACTN|nr:DUF4328 domain-containing protein [Streptomyces ficellus]QGV78928.1 DUF4328 domain-containing protein [Streptomyces ficellus]